MLSRQAARATAQAVKAQQRAFSLCVVNMNDLSPIEEDVRQRVEAKTPEQLTKDVKEEMFPKIGDRDIVGPSYSTTFDYFDMKDYPLPSIRWGENTAEIAALREKETGDWKDLTLEEKKQLYRHSFRQTIAEFTAPTGQWKRITYMVFYTLMISVVMLYYSAEAYTKANSYTAEKSDQQVTTLLLKNVGPTFGISSKYDFEKNEWKK